MAEVGGALRTRLWRGGGGARGQGQGRQEQPQRARARAHGAPRPWQPPLRRHTTPPTIPPRKNYVAKINNLAPNVVLAPDVVRTPDVTALKLSTLNTLHHVMSVSRPQTIRFAESIWNK